MSAYSSPLSTSTSAVNFRYKDIALAEACWVNGEPYFTRRAIGMWLEYRYPQEAVDKIIGRNPYIRDPRWSRHIKLTCLQPLSKQPKLGCLLDQNSGIQYTREIETEVFSPVGLQLIVFESSQKKALRYKVAVANLVWAYMKGKLPAYQPPREKILHAAGFLRELEHMVWGRRVRAVDEFGEKIGRSRATLYRWRKHLEATGVLPSRRQGAS